MSDAQPHNILEPNRTQGRVVGYARGTMDQSAGLATQRRELRGAGAQKIVGEQSASTAPRPKLAACLRTLREGDALICTSPDRLALSVAELLEIEADLSKRGITLAVLSVGGEKLDTSKASGKRMLAVLRDVAGWQREIRLERLREGVAKAKAAGRYRGRKPTIDRTRIRQLRAELGPAAIAKKLGIARSSVYRLLPR